MERRIGKVTIEEKDEILSLFERKNGLNELSLIVKEGDSLYPKMIEDISKTEIQFQNWWQRMADKYGWERKQDYEWEIDFDTCEIILKPKNEIICNY